MHCVWPTNALKRPAEKEREGSRESVREGRRE